jgi:hypothetical protein
MNWLRLKYLEFQLAFGEFGKHKKYLRFCHERKATTSADRVKIAQDVLDGPAINSLESWAHAIYLKEHSA